MLVSYILRSMLFLYIVSIPISLSWGIWFSFVDGFILFSSIVAFATIVSYLTLVISGTD